MLAEAHNALVRVEARPPWILRQFLRLTIARGSYLEVVYSQRVGAGEASLGGADLANVHGGVIPDLDETVEAAKRVDDLGSIVCSPLSLLCRHPSRQIHCSSVAMPRDCTEALEMELTKGRVLNQKSCHRY